MHCAFMGVDAIFHSVVGLVGAGALLLKNLRGVGASTHRVLAGPSSMVDTGLAAKRQAANVEAVSNLSGRPPGADTLALKGMSRPGTHADASGTLHNAAHRIAVSVTRTVISRWLVDRGLHCAVVGAGARGCKRTAVHTRPSPVAHAWPSSRNTVAGA